MRISAGKLGGRKVWELDNEACALVVMEEGGHLASLRLHTGPKINPLWVPCWKTMEPRQYRTADAKRYDCRLLASISGHNLCLGAFGPPSPEEARAGIEVHGEAPVRRWPVAQKQVQASRLKFVYGCELPIAQMRFQRTIRTTKGSSVFRITERVTNLERKDTPFTMCEHVTFGPPFLEKGVTVFDMSATRGRTFPEAFSDAQRLKTNTDFVWPAGPGRRGSLDLRTIGAQARRSSDFSAQLMDPRKESAWFSAVNPRQGLLVAYVWRRTDFPWLGNWEENYARQTPPWNGKSLTRGMEFSNAPFPVGLRQSVTLGHLFGVPTYAWLPALGAVTIEYAVIIRPVARNCKGVAGIRPVGGDFEFELMV